MEENKFDNVRYDINLVESYLPPILVNEREIEPNIMKESQSFHVVHFWYCSTSWPFESCQKCYLSWFIPEGLQDILDEKICSIQKF